MATHNKKGGQGRMPPDGEIRRSQMLTTYGPGALVDLVNDAVIVSGLEYWKVRHGQWQVVKEPRLREKLVEKLKARGQYLSEDKAFRMPPMGDDGEPSRFQGVGASIFPFWFVCTGCRRLIRASELETRAGRFVHDCGPGKKKLDCVPMRFVAVCKDGHIDDFPWVWFAHKGGGCQNPQVKFTEDATGDFASMKIECLSCGSDRLLIDAMVEGQNQNCKGKRPWLGPMGDEAGCMAPARLMVRTASNAYFSQVESALTIPSGGPRVHDAVRGQWGILQAATEQTLPAFRHIPAVQAALGGMTDAEVLRAVLDIRLGVKLEPEPLREAEFKEFMRQPEEKAGDLPGRRAQFFARRAVREEGLAAQVEAVVLARKLREVRVQVGFTRLNPVSPNFHGDLEIGSKMAPLSLSADWLPAIEVMGEGIFIKLDEGMLKAWEERPAVVERSARLRVAFEQYYAERAKVDEDYVAPVFPGARFYMLHSLSHLLLTALSLECGYAASAIRERIYFGGEGSGMTGLLLSTGTPGSEGTLGGLVEQGHRLGVHLSRALQLGALCSHDPVCASHDPIQDRADRNLDGAACHGCLYVSESSCEHFNRHLDRALVVPCLGHPAELAFFGGS